MGIDIYMSWKDQTKEEKEAQLTGFSVHSGHVGYLREAYHGGPYATKVLLPECFGLPVEDPQDRGLVNPVNDEDRTFEYPYWVLRRRLELTLATAKERSIRVYQEPSEDDSPQIKAFTDFVELAERKEKETGKPVTIYASY
jgi:hypothetical protein